jgi:predicted DNA-binding mobile mystery protein A
MGNKINFFSNEITNKFQSWEKVPEWLRSYVDTPDQIRLIREELGMTQEQLGKRIGSSGRIVRRIENREITPNLATIQKIAQAINTECKVLLIPKKPIDAYIKEYAQELAKKQLNRINKNSALEKQALRQEAYKRVLEETTKDIIDNKRKSLWNQ